MGDGSALTPGEGMENRAADRPAKMLAWRATGGYGWAGGVTGSVSRLGEDATSRS